MPNNTQRLEAVGKADALADLLNHVGWTEVLKPALEKERTVQASLLVASVLGKQDPNGLTKEQIAGYIYGLDRVIKQIETILAKGTNALEALEAQGFHFTSNNL